MKKDLPSVYSNPIDKDIKNNSDYFYGKANLDVKSPRDIESSVNNIFKSKNFVYKRKVRITTFDGSDEVFLVGRNNSSLLTLDNKRIPIVNITDIEILD